MSSGRGGSGRSGGGRGGIRRGAGARDTKSGPGQGDDKGNTMTAEEIEREEQRLQEELQRKQEEEEALRAVGHNPKECID